MPRFSVYHDPKQILTAANNNIYKSLLKENNGKTQALAKKVANKINVTVPKMSVILDPMFNFLMEVRDYAVEENKMKTHKKFEYKVNDRLNEKKGHFDNYKWHIFYYFYSDDIGLSYTNFNKNKSTRWGVDITFDKFDKSAKGAKSFRLGIGHEHIGFSIHPKIDTNNTCEETTPIIDALLPGKQHSQLWEKCLILFTTSELEDIYNCLVGAESTWQTAANDILDIYDEFKNKRKIFSAPFSFMPDNILRAYKQRAQNTSISQNISKSCQTAYDKQNIQEMTNKSHKLTAGEIMAKGQELIDNGCAVIH